MGAMGSGLRLWQVQKATTVEECLSLDVGTLVRGGFLLNGRSGIIRWAHPATGEETASVRFTTMLGHGGGPVLILHYEEAETSVFLTTTVPPFGGVRWWFTCPLVVEGWPCQRRVRKLYLPPGRRYFGCRTCHRLTYRSTQERGTRFGAFRALMGR